MSMDQLMALVPIEAAHSILDKGRKSRWEKTKERIGGSRWGAIEDKPYFPPPYVDLPPGMTPAQTDQFLREQRFDELSKKLSQGELEFGDPDIRPPSPPPVYDKHGSRINTRDVRVRNAMNSEYQRLVEYMVKHVDGFVPPADFKPSKRIRRIEIPLDKYPDYNFMGLIIGPRGCNHKRLESESGSQISIRGKGTQKEGKRADHQTDEEAGMPMHVHLAADSDEAVEKAVALIEPLLDPCHPMHEEFKKRGLEQLALVNGVSFGQLDQQRCASCSAVGHLAYDCPDAQKIQNFKKPEVRCAICGDMGHVTMDCKLVKNNHLVEDGNSASASGLVPPPPRAPPKNPHLAYFQKLKIDQEYKKMMNELGGDFLASEDQQEDSKHSVEAKHVFNVVRDHKESRDSRMSPVQLSGTPPPGVSPVASHNTFSATLSGTRNHAEPFCNANSPVPPPPPVELRSSTPNLMWEETASWSESNNTATVNSVSGMPRSSFLRPQIGSRAAVGIPERARMIRGILPPNRGSYFMRGGMMPYSEYGVSPVYTQHMQGISNLGVGNAMAGPIHPFYGQMYLPYAHQSYNHPQVHMETFMPPTDTATPPAPTDAPPLPPGGMYDPNSVMAMQMMMNPMFMSSQASNGANADSADPHSSNGVSPSGEAAMDMSN